MKIFSYFTEDLKSIIKNPASIGTLIGLILIPGFYAWFNIIASWDPYSNTQNIKIAVANQDQWTEVFWKNLNIGADIIENLKENHNMWWNFLSEEDTRNGVYHWDYYAGIIIWENFSKDLASFLTDNPKKPVLEYIVNEKINAISPKITGKWVEALSETIEANFISSIYENFFKQSNLAAEKIQAYEQNAIKAKNLIDKIVTHLPEIRKILEKWQKTSKEWIKAINKIQAELPHLQKILWKIIQWTENKINISVYAEKISETLRGYFSIVELLAYDGVRYSDFAHQKIENLQNSLLPILQNTQHKMIIANRILGNIEKFFIKINSITGIKIFDKAINKTQDLESKINNYLSINRKIYTSINRWEQISEDVLIKIMEWANNINRSLASLWEYLQGDFIKNSQEAEKYLWNIFQNIHNESLFLNNKIPEIEQKINNINTWLTQWEYKIEQILQHWNNIEHSLLTAQKIFGKMNDERIASLLEIMLLNPDDEKNFFRHPVQIKTTSLFSSPNYWSAIAPFFTVLALWTWALLASSILSVRSWRAIKEKYIRHWYISRLLFFLIIGFFQALIVTFGNVYMLGIYVAHPWLLFLANILIISLFHIIIFSVVFLFGKIGNVIAILLLLIQLSAWSGTFPVELTNDIFIKIHPYIPFTYAIDLLREVSLGLVEVVFWKNVFILIFMLVWFLIIWLLLSPKLSPFAIKFNKRTEGIDVFN